jgi:hypothetical protein
VLEEEADISTVDRRCQSCRMNCRAAEKALRGSMGHHGIREPLQGVHSHEGRVLLEGFRSYGCAKPLAIQRVPSHAPGRDEAFGIGGLVRISETPGVCAFWSKRDSSRS